jgi:hypothetical protein
MTLTINNSAYSTLLAALHAPISPRIAIIGPTGCGKTTLVYNAASKAGFDIIEVNASATSLKQIEDTLHDIVMNTTIDTFFAPTKKLLFIDDVDILMMSFPKLASYLVTWLKGTIRYPILFCIQSQEERRLSDLKNIVTILRLSRPSTQECLAHFINETKDQRVDESHLLQLIKAHKHDLRAISANLSQLTNNKVTTDVNGNSTIHIDSLRATFSDLTLYDIQNKIFATPLSNTHLDELVYTDSKLLGLLLYENVSTELRKNRITKGTDTKIMLAHLSCLSDVYIQCDKLETFMNANMYYDIAPIFNNVMLGTVNHIIHSWQRTSTPDTSFVFTPMMTKTALRYQFAKRKTAFLREYGLSSSHFCDAVAIAASYLGAKQPRERIVNNELLKLSKTTIDTAAKWGTDYELITTMRATAWKKFARKQAKDAGADTNSSDES